MFYGVLPGEMRLKRLTHNEGRCSVNGKDICSINGGRSFHFALDSAFALDLRNTTLNGQSFFRGSAQPTYPAFLIAMPLAYCRFARLILANPFVPVSSI